MVTGSWKTYVHGHSLSSELSVLLTPFQICAHISSPRHFSFAPLSALRTLQIPTSLKCEALDLATPSQQLL
jgi:hypothetical protein